MKHFKIILTALTVVLAALFLLNVIYMSQLYNSIKQRYIDDIEQSLRRADHIEIVDRIVASGYADDNDVVWLKLGLQKSEIGMTGDTEDMVRNGYSQGFKRPDTQVLTVVSDYLHKNYTADINKPDLEELESAFRRDLKFSGYEPETVVIALPENCYEISGDLCHIPYKIDNELIYDVYISPLTKNILNEMAGVIISSALIAFVLVAGFIYLLVIIKNMRSIEEMKDDFTNNITHELKTPIAIAYAANDALLQYPDKDISERTHLYLSAALDQLNKLNVLVESILSMSLERNKKMVIHKKDFKLKPVLLKIAEQIQLGTSKECNITIDCDDNLILTADEAHFSNMITNILDNSIKYSKDQISLKISADENMISVSDNGIGIPEKAIPEIFKRFYRIPLGNTTSVRGYGIGLYYVKTIADKHGWEIDVKSKINQGTTVTFLNLKNEK